MGKAVGSIAGGVLGGMVGGPMGAQIGSGIGGALLGGGGGSSGGYDASAAQAAQQRAAAAAASASAFRPVGMTTRFGSSNFTMGTDQYGNPIVTGASYEASPEIKALQDRLSAMYGSSLGQAEQAQAQAQPLGAAAQGLFSLGQQYLAKSPEQAAQDYYNQQQAMLAPTRQAEEQRLGASVFGRGRAGLNIANQGQPELAALASARRQQDLGLAAQAEQAAQQRINFGSGLFTQGAGQLGSMYGLQTQALSPFQSQFGTVQQLEQAALQPLELGAALGGRNINTAGANAMLQGGLASARTGLEAQQAAAAAQQGGQNQLMGLLGGSNAANIYGSIGGGIKDIYSGLFGGSSGYNGQMGYQQFLEGYGGAE